MLVKALKGRHRYSETEGWNNEKSDYDWISCKDFTVDEGKRQIREYINTWDIQPRWLYSLYFLCSTEEEEHSFYHYQARFSTPSPQKPIQGTVSVYFAVGVSKVKPDTLPVEVVFVMESNRLVHTPGWMTFRETWLADVIESKNMVQGAADLWAATEWMLSKRRIRTFSWLHHPAYSRDFITILHQDVWFNLILNAVGKQI